MSNSNEGKIKILIADDHPAVRYGVRSILQLEPTIQIIGEATSGDEVIEILKEKKADLLIMDVKMPGKDSVELVKKLRNWKPELKILAFSIYDDQFRVYSMVNAGVHGYLLKSADDNEMVKAINTLMQGDKYLSREVSEKVLNAMMSAGEKSEELTGQPLSKREEEILKMLTRDNSYAEIAVALGISKRTVDTHRYNISKKLGIKNLAGLIRYAINHGLT